MAGASQFPLLIDTDVELLRRTAADAVVPADHNNLVDAIQSLELMVGTTEDGTRLNGQTTFKTALSHYVNMPSTGIPNPRFPIVPVQSQSWYASNKADNVLWTKAGGLVTDYTSAPGFVYMSAPNGTAVAYATVDIPVEWTNICAAIRFRTFVPVVTSAWWFGFVTDADPTGATGAQVTHTTALFSTLAPLQGGIASTAYFTSPSLTNHLFLSYIAGEVFVSWSPDGVARSGPLGSILGTDRPTKLFIGRKTASTTPWKALIDYISIGPAWS